MPHLAAISVGAIEHLGVHGAADRHDERWSTGIFKAAREGPVRLYSEHLAGDAQADRLNHGGPDKAICAFSADHYREWAATFHEPALAWGAFGENFTIHGLTEADVCVGDVWAIGEVRVQVSQPRQPCWKLARKWRIDDLVERILARGHTGWYFRVCREGTVEAGAPITLVTRSHAEWTIARANEVMHRQRGDATAARALAAVDALSASWKETLEKRAAVLGGHPS